MHILCCMSCTTRVFNVVQTDLRLHTASCCGMYLQEGVEAPNALLGLGGLADVRVHLQHQQEGTGRIVGLVSG
jgi:hypothetical protein